MWHLHISSHACTDYLFDFSCLSEGHFLASNKVIQLNLPFVVHWRYKNSISMMLFKNIHDSKLVGYRIIFGLIVYQFIIGGFACLYEKCSKNFYEVFCVALLQPVMLTISILSSIDFIITICAIYSIKHSQLQSVIELMLRYFWFSLEKKICTRHI